MRTRADQRKQPRLATLPRAAKLCPSRTPAPESIWLGSEQELTGPGLHTTRGCGDWAFVALPPLGQ